MSQYAAIVSYFSTGAYDANTVDEDQILSDLLTELGVKNKIVAWSDPSVNWSEFSCLLIKSVWDYFDYYPEFLLWIEKVRKLGIPVWNDLDLIRWNSTKSYLLEIAERGYPVIAGMLLEKGKKIDFQEIQSKISADTLVIKPLVSGGAKNTLKIPVSQWADFEGKVEMMIQEEDYLVQPFISEVAEVGEYSLLFFNGVFSHAVLKTPAQSDFRVQHYFGGTIKTIEPDKQLLESAKSFVREFAQNTLYARVDGVLINGEFNLMELELIEPYLFLGLVDQAIPNYKQALKERLL
ncbi:glutathione synthetase [Algoriphagus sp. CAU 1675]|uniref:ATP-grasp domain-containing protein n=1 Tax=Algoriphagus sp. CAU 1675 TaxID=3032597 RepID=UPI0023DB36D8|nr:glutathione synthetase [Algoriphagus sp. CAU 1675]MDF2158064.1 glutathione synthetase [Algoriphagus sp. CAU 1675]